MNVAYNMLKDYIPVRNALKTRANDELMIASNHNNEIYYLNATAHEMWELIDGIISVDGLCSKILSEYEADRETIENDVVNFIRDLQWKKLIRLRIGGTVQ